MNAARAVATVGGVGLLRPAPGTWGSAAALPLAWALHALGGWIALAIGIAVLLPLGAWAVGAMGGPDPDPSEAVIDEVAGQWIALLPISYGAIFAGADILALWPGWIAAFAAFRLFDIWKPGPVGVFDRRHTPWGVMLDDVAAGVLAALAVIALAILYHVVFLDVLP